MTKGPDYCPVCEKAQREPLTGLTKAGCRGCAIRELARSPIYHASGLDGWLAQDYVRALSAIFGDDYRAGHQLVKAERQRQKAASA